MAGNEQLQPFGLATLQPLVLPTLQPFLSISLRYSTLQTLPSSAISVPVVVPSAPVPAPLTSAAPLSAQPTPQPSNAAPVPISIESSIPVMTSILHTSKAPAAPSPVEPAPTILSTSKAPPALQTSSAPFAPPTGSAMLSIIPATQTSPSASETTTVALPSTVTSPNRRAAIGGLVAGVVLFLLIFIAVAVFLTKRFRRRDEEAFVSSGYDGRHSPAFMTRPEKEIIETTSDLTTEKSVFETTSEVVEHPGLTPWNEEQRNQIIAMAEKRKEEILAEKQLLAVNRFVRLNRLRRQTMALPNKLKSSLSKKENGEPRAATVSLPPPPRPNRASTLSQFQVPIEGQDQVDYISQSPLIEPTRPSSEYSRQSGIWDSLSTISEVSHVIQDNSPIEDMSPSQRSSVTHRISGLVISRDTINWKRATVESYSSKVSSSDDESGPEDNRRGRREKREAGNRESIPVMLEVPPRNPARLTRSSSLRTTKSRVMSPVSDLGFLV